MIKFLLNNILDNFQAKYDYDVTHFKSVVNASTRGGISLAMSFGLFDNRFGLNPLHYHAAKLVSEKRVDCGSCVRLVFMMAEEEGVHISDLAPLFLPNGKPRAELDLIARYCDAVLDNDTSLAHILHECEERFGVQALVGLSNAVAAGQYLPLLKRGMGHGNSCEPIAAWLKSKQRDLPIAAE